MKLTFRNSISKQIARLLIVVLGLFILNNAVFLHAHRLPDGQVILHAHPYKKSQDPAPIKTHHHTAPELFVLAQLQFLFFVLITLSATVLRIGYKRVFSSIYPSLHLKYFAKSRGRSPPTLFGMDLQPL
ncbi:putative membrane protein [Proteiniphilum saccharofermentans]|uniref:Putative membrane protein n=1 Tax=Proteiniphilum saccharofermentans TaxID=1642647 RepID=A0A1R3T6Q8_9BACT|nr:hypothetical protein [Proteiniphilum saccharofermentans]SCD21912.1 putative membrane protein [Proteiniphilum saccharofermentans]